MKRRLTHYKAAALLATADEPALCGRPMVWHVTSDVENVTCPRCARKLAKQSAVGGKVIDLMTALKDALATTKGKPPTSPATAKSRPAPSPDLSTELERLAAADRAPETEPGKTP